MSFSPPAYHDTQPVQVSLVYQKEEEDPGHGSYVLTNNAIGSSRVPTRPCLSPPDPHQSLLWSCSRPPYHCMAAGICTSLGPRGAASGCSWSCLPWVQTLKIPMHLNLLGQSWNSLPQDHQSPSHKDSGQRGSLDFCLKLPSPLGSKKKKKKSLASVPLPRPLFSSMQAPCAPLPMKCKPLQRAPCWSTKASATLRCVGIPIFWLPRAEKNNCNSMLRLATFTLKGQWQPTTLVGYMPVQWAEHTPEPQDWVMAKLSL